MITRPWHPLACVRRDVDREVATADARLEAREEAAALMAWLSEQKPAPPGTVSGAAHALVLRLRFLEDRSLHYVGGVLGVGHERVRQMEHKARAWIRERWRKP